MAPRESQNRIKESLRLEKTSKVIESNRHPNTTMPVNPKDPSVGWL